MKRYCNDHKEGAEASKSVSILLLLILPFSICYSQGNFKGLESLFTSLRGYQAVYTSHPPIIDGSSNDTAWAAAPWSADFVDIEGSLKPLPALSTKMKMLWNDSAIFICAALKDPHVWATLSEHDTVLYMDNDFEVFIDPNDDGLEYYELEVNPKNTVFDLFLPRPYRDKGNAIIAYDFPGLQTAVKINGTINDASDKDSGWTVEIAIPFRALDLRKAFIPGNENARWRINFSRVEYDIEVAQGKYVKKKNQDGRSLPEHNWVWSPQGVINMHFPERWGFVEFAKTATTDYAFKVPYADEQKKYLWLIYYRQREMFKNKNIYSSKLSAFGLENNVIIDGRPNKINIETTAHQFMARISDGQTLWSINQDGTIGQE